MDYKDFLRERRELMSLVIRDAYLKLAQGEAYDPLAPPAISVEQLVNDGENKTVEFKSTLRTNLHTGEKDPKMELMVLKTIAAFINGNGGTLVVGVADDGQPVGIEADAFKSEDSMNLHLVNLLKDRVGPQHAMYVHPRFDDYEGARVLTIECLKGKAPVFVKDGRQELFYVRNGAATLELTPSQTQTYIKARFAI